MKTDNSKQLVHDLIHHEYRYELRRTMMSLRTRSIDKCYIDPITQPFGLFETFHDKGRELFEDFESLFYVVIDKHPAAIDDILKETRLQLNDIEVWKKVNPGMDEKEPFKYIIDMVNRTALLLDSEKFNSNTTSREDTETTENTVRQILAPLTKIGTKGQKIVSDNDFEILVNTYVGWIDKGRDVNEHSKKFNFHGINREFFKPLRDLHDAFKLPMTESGIGNVLNKLLYVNNGKSNDAMSPGTIKRNLLSIKNNKTAPK